MHDEWRFHRSLMSKPFQFSQLKLMAASMTGVAEKLAVYMNTLPQGAVCISFPFFYSLLCSPFSEVLLLPIPHTYGHIIKI